MKIALVGPRFDSKKINTPWVAVDGGLDHWKKVGSDPLFAVGDWDSLKNKKLLSRVDHATLPRKKDRNDLYYALQIVKSLPVREIELFGFHDGRLDHEWANLAELARFAKENKKLLLTCHGPKERIFFVSGRKISLKLKRGQTVSVFSVGEKPATGVTIKGLEYSLSNGRLEATSLGLSNRVVRPRCQFSVGTGVLMIIINQ